MAGLSRIQYLDADGKSKVKYTFQRKLDHPRRSREMNQAEKGVEEPQVSGRFLPKKRLEKSDNIEPSAPGSDLMKMKKYATFDDYLDDQPPKARSIIRALRKFVKRVEPDLQEAVKWGNGCWVKGKQPISYVYSAPDHVQFGFIRGHALKDPRGLLEGNGQYVRHVKVRKPSDIDEDMFQAFLRQAVH